MGQRLRVVVATPLTAETVAQVERLEPRVQLVHAPELVRPPRYPADHQGDPTWRRTPAQRRRFEELLDGAEALYGIPDEDPVALRRTVTANPRLRWVQTMAAGGGAQVGAAGLTPEQLDRVVFTTAAGVHAGPLTEFVLLGLLAGAKQLPRLQGDAARRTWAARWQMGQLREQTVLVVGLGGIGREVARVLGAFGTRVLGTSRRGEPVPGVAELVHPDDLVAAVGRVDGIVVTLPATATTEKLVGAEVLAAVRPGATLVNVGRGTVVDEPALVEALRCGRIGFAALDVVATEPLAASSPLWSLPNVLISPHIAALTPTEAGRIAELFADNATRLLTARPLRNVVNTAEFY